MGYKQIDYSKIESPFPVEQIDKGHIKITPLNEAFGNAKTVVSSRLKTQPIPVPVRSNLGE